MRTFRLMAALFTIVVAPVFLECTPGMAADDDDTLGSEGYEGDVAGECEDGADNDMDGLYDCNDPDCAGAPVCEGGDDDTGPPDDDDTGPPDDDDTGPPDDDDTGPPDDDDTGPPDDDDTAQSEDCGNEIDDNGDGLIDCDDPICGYHPDCGGEDCTNGSDDNGDGLIDCDDPDCVGHPDC